MNKARKNIISDMFQRPNNFSIIAGPCAIESYEQLEHIAESLLELGLIFFRGGAFKPRTSPYSFQGIGHEGLKMLGAIRNKYNLRIVSEIMDVRDIELGLQYIDLIQIGSRNMHNTPLLKELGKTNHPVLLKRGWMATLEEFLMAVEYIRSEGNNNIAVCERGIRTFETSTRNTLDISSVAIIKKETNLPIIIDLSHSLGRKDIMLPVAKAVYALGADGIMIEVHNNPQKALSDSSQQLSIDEFSQFHHNLMLFINS
jgi:3-deoxy-7-phosphoheptulonate synthase